MMKHLLSKIILLIFFSFITKAQTSSSKIIHDQASKNIADVLFDSKAKSIRERAKTFENSCGIKVQFKVDEQSLDKLGGLSEHLFRLFQNFTTSENTNAKTITAEFSALSNEVLTDVLTYKTNATQDLATCSLPIKDTQKLDSLYTKSLNGSSLSFEEKNEAPESLNELYSQSIDDYERILFKNKDCPSLFNADAYTQHVINTRQSRSTNWAADANGLSLSISANFGQLTNNSPNSSSQSNNGSTGVNLNINPSQFSGHYVQTLNTCINTCTKEDMEVRCRMLYAKTNIRFLFITKDLDYYLPIDSINKFRDVAAQTFTNSSTDQVILALYLKMKDGPQSTGVVAVKQINGDWLTNADINFANYNNGGDYKAGTFSKFKNIYKNIPKPLILCYQVAKVNGLLTTSYFNKGESIKGREQIYYHIFKTDGAFEEISQLHDQLSSLYSSNTSAGGSVIGANAITSSATFEKIDEIKNKIRITYLKAAKEPKFNEASEHFKEVYLQTKSVAEVAALKYLRDKYGLLYKNNKFDALIANTGLPDDIKVGSCKASETSDVIGDALNITSLILSPTGLDFIPDALAVAYYAATDNTYEFMWASASFLIPGSLSGAKKILSSGADAIKEINVGSKLLLEGGQLKAIEQDVNYISSMFNIKPQDVDASLVSKINTNPAVTNNLLPITAAQAKVYSNTEKLAPEKRLEFVKKCYDDDSFRQKCLNDPEEVLRWGGIVELIRGVSKTDFIGSVSEFASNSQIAEQAWTFFKNENWNQLETLVKNNNINGGWPPNNGFKNILKVENGSQLSGKTFDRFQNSANLSGSFASPVNTGEGLQDLVFTYDSRALNTQIPQNTYYIKFKLLSNLPSSLKFDFGEAIPWFNTSGTADQIKSSIKFSDLIEGIDYQVIEKLKYVNGNWIIVN
ncbi:hypothetical protein [Aurantibacillus circumpalustris]|uniref:hypothetical protein n=1 Tax=Aurantibacillus circumpalustris TaxID=3036359 RepID=UPI00295AB284|nr:hypothetical protein [Aurantibacillus circumpalustris]